MKDLTDVDTFHLVITVPEDGIDPRTAASIEDAFQKLADRTYNNRSRLLPIENDIVFLNEQDMSFCVLAPAAGDTDWTLSESTTDGERYVESVSVGDYPRLTPIQGLPVGWEITEYALILKGPSVHAADIGPRVQLFRVHLGTGAVVGTGATDSTNTAGYDNWHEMVVTVASPVTITTGDTYTMLINGERGSGALAGVQIAGFRIKCEAP